MESRWEKRPPPLPPPSLERELPSFSAALLDAIYRSIDTSPNHSNKQRPPDLITNVNVPPAEFWRDPRATITDHRNVPSTPKRYPTTPRYRTASVSSTSTPRHRPNRPTRVLPDPLVVTDPPRCEEIDKEKTKKKKKKKSIKSFLKSLFFIKQDKKGKLLADKPEKMRKSMMEPVRHSSRSCVSNKSKSDGQKRTVRFAPMSVIVDEESRPCGHKRVYDNGAVERQVEELINSLKGSEKKKRNENSSSSSELFEL